MYMHSLSVGHAPYTIFMIFSSVNTFTPKDEFGRGCFKLARDLSEVYAMNDGKAGSFVI